MPLIAQPLQRGKRRDGNTTRLLECHISRLERKNRLTRAHVFSKSTAAPAKHIVASLKILYIFPDSLYSARHIHPESHVLRLTQPSHEANAIRRASNEMPIQRIQRGRADLDQNFIVPRNRLGRLFVSENVRRTIPLIHDRFHAWPRLGQLKNSPSKFVGSRIPASITLWRKTP